MLVRHILAATDESEAGRQAVRSAFDLASRCSARLTVLRVVAVEAAPRFAGVAEGTGLVGLPEEDPELERLRRWLDADVIPEPDAGRVELGLGYGIPSIEICRFAERHQADLLVLGRKQHSHMMRLLLGDTADAVARRSRVPCLFVPPRTSRMDRVLAALDGSDRGMIVLQHACDFASQSGAQLQAITVERVQNPPALPLGSALPLTRSISLQDRIAQVAGQKGLAQVPLSIQQGDVLERTVARAQEIEADVLAVGYHRGGPPGVLEAGSIARRLVHASPCAVLTIPL